eukprot:7806271-Ditylum_brightwellii.AAC.1
MGINYAVGNKDNDDDDNTNNGVDYGNEDGNDTRVEYGVYYGDMHLTHLLQGTNCQFPRRSKQNKHIDGNKENGVDNSVDNSVEYSDDDSVDD